MGALVPYPLGASPSQRFRLEQWIPVLEREGIRLEMRPFAHPALMKILHAPRRSATKAVSLARAFVRRLVDTMALARYDAIVVHRAAALFGPALVERLAAWRRPLIFDFDDAIFLTHTTAANRRFGWLKFAGKTATICRMSSHVVVGNDYLATYARRYNPRVTVVPSSVDTDRYTPGPRRADERLVIGWMGSSTSQTHLELFAPLLGRLTQSRDVEIRVVSDRRPDLADVPVVWRRWTAEREVENLRAFDIGIMPMPDDPWAEGKCGMKALLYMSVGVPAVCSAVGVNRQIIRHGENGLLASSTDDWVRCLEDLVDQPELRARLGKGGRQTVEADYSMMVCARRFGAVVRESVTAGKQP